MKSFIMEMNSTPRKMVVRVARMPKSPIRVPVIIMAPSLPIRPKDIINIPMPGKKLVRGSGIRIERAKVKIKKPIILSKIPLLRKVNLGFDSLSILLNIIADFSII